MLLIHNGNRLETLLELLAEQLARPLSDPFTPERIVVQHPGMGRWVAQQLARRNGVAANLEYPLPGRFLWWLLGHWFEDLPRDSDWSRERLTWRLLGLLGELGEEAVFDEPRRYLDGEPAELKTYQLARRIADLFDQYLVYRPEMLLGWEAGREAHWQARLWRALLEQGLGPHRARLFARLAEALRAGRAPRRALPERILFFGLTALPPVDCELLAQLGRFTEIQLFVLNPCREYWADILDEGQRTRRRARALRAGLPDPGALLELGNPLLASWGHASQAFLDQLLDMGDPIDCFESPDESRLLGRLQTDLLDLRDRRDAPPDQRLRLAPDDVSVQLHLCHGVLREVQVLHDRLLHLFETLPGLTPRDILVMAPDIDRYAPAIGAVFGAAVAGHAIPWSIADRRPALEHPLLAALAALFDLPDSRLGVTEVLGWLEIAAIRRRFGIEEAGLEWIRRWIEESAIRWGIDGVMREGFDLPAEEAHSWRFGLERLFLGYALAPDGELYENLLPCAEVEGQRVATLGGLQEFLDRLARWREGLRAPRPLIEWVESLQALMAECLAPDEDEDLALRPLRLMLDRLRADAEALGFSAPVGRALIRAEVREALALAAPTQHFLTGRVTFCNMVPMRSIPARVVCLLGMNGSDFPRDQRPAAFDLMAREPRRGDRLRRQDDRNLFLEALLSARDVFYVSWLAFDARDNAPRVPSVMLNELLDALDRSECAPDGGLLSDWLCVKHPLQPFSARYFTGAQPRLFSYHADWCAAAASPAAPAPPFAATPLPALAGERSVDLADLLRFLRLPARWFLTRRLGLRAPDEPLLLDEREPFVLHGLEGWQLRQRLWDLVATQGSPEPLLRAAGELPHGVVGSLTLERAQRRVERFHRKLLPYLEAPRPALEVDLRCGEWRVQGWMQGLYGGGLLRYRLGRLRAVDRLQLWAEHLVLNALEPDGGHSSRFVAEDDLLSLTPYASAAERLAELLELYQEGQNQPQPLFPETSWAEACAKLPARDKAWLGDDFSELRGESEDEAVRIAFRGYADPLAETPFAQLAQRLFKPMIDHEESPHG